MTQDDLRLGFRVDAFLDLHRWKVIDVGPNVPLVSPSSCPCDEGTLRTLCTFASSDGVVRVRVGRCVECGHITYIDRPSRAWMDDYYLTVWDANDLDRRMGKRIRKLATDSIEEKTVVAITKSLSVDRSRPVCEIGCGWGESLEHLRCAGFSRLARARGGAPWVRAR